MEQEAGDRGSGAKTLEPEQRGQSWLCEKVLRVWDFIAILSFLSAKKSHGENECPPPKIPMSITIS